jgi:plasmid stabilization system protein ParE
MSSYAFHPDALADLNEILEYIAEDNLDAADRVLADIHTVLRTLAGSPHIGHRRLDLTARPLRFHVVRNKSSLPMRQTRSRFGWSRFFTGAGIRG